MIGAQNIDARQVQAPAHWRADPAVMRSSGVILIDWRCLPRCRLERKSPGLGLAFHRGDHQIVAGQLENNGFVAPPAFLEYSCTMIVAFQPIKGLQKPCLAACSVSHMTTAMPGYLQHLITQRRAIDHAECRSGIIVSRCAQSGDRQTHTLGEATAASRSLSRGAE